MKYIKDFFKYCFDFVGVASRKEYWVPMLLILAVNTLLWGLTFVTVYFTIPAIIINLILLCPTLSLLARRLHDTDRSALNMLWLLFPGVGWVILLIYTLEKTKYFVD